MINLGFTIAEYPIVRMGSLRLARFALPLQVAAVCYRWRGSSAEFLLVNTNGGGKWTFPKGDPHRHLSHSQAARREALEEAGGTGRIEPRHFHLYIHSKGVFWQTARGTGVVIKAFLLEVEEIRTPYEPETNPNATPRGFPQKKPRRCSLRVAR